jgi:gliding motility-associated-like protein
MILRNILLLVSVLIIFPIFGQPPNDDCADALTLCAGQALSGDNTGSLGGTGFCPGTSDLLWYTFTTNSVGGDATISMSGLSCSSGLGIDNEMSMVVLSGNGNCNLPDFTAAGPCAQDSVDFTVTATALMPSTVYWLLISGVQNGGATSPANCAFDIVMTGPAVDIVDVDFDAGNSFEITDGETVQLNATGGGGNYVWSPTAGLSGNGISNPFASPSVTTVYTVSTNMNGCTYSDTVSVNVVVLINPPNTFTPNGDGFNDTWEIPGISAFPNAEVVVYDRWGQKVFVSNGYSEEWDGTNNGRALTTATFYYYIRLNKLEGQAPPITGAVSIIK